jgi:folate-binding protein YgfZ
MTDMDYRRGEREVRRIMTLHELQSAAGAIFEDRGGLRAAQHYGDVQAEYAALRRGLVLHERAAAGLIEVTGRDRAAWLHNFLTHEIRALGPGEGNYGFALNAKGRVVFDAQVLAAEDRLLMNIDRRWTATALKHLGRYIIMEDVQLQDVSSDHVWLALAGPACAELCTALGLAHAAAMAQLQHAAVMIARIPARCVRHDFCGIPAVELLVAAEHAAELWAALAEAGRPLGLRPAGCQAVESARVEAGIPASLADIDDQVLPAETGQLERAVSFNKGCYLGQEVVERMRARRAVARLLVGLRFEGSGERRPAGAGGTVGAAATEAGEAGAAGAALEHDGQPAGRVTSAVDSYGLGARIGLGYVQTALAKPGTPLTARMNEHTRACVVSALPFAVPGY